MVEIVVFEGVGHFERKFQAEWGVAYQRLLASEYWSHWAIVCVVCVVCVILGLAVLVGHRLVTDRWTDGRTHDDGKYRASIASRV